MNIEKKNTKKQKTDFHTLELIKKIPPTVLLCYTYTLNLFNSKTISTGFTLEDCEAKVVLNDVLQGFVELSCLEWYSLFLKLNTLNEIIQRLINNETMDQIKNKLVITRNLSIKITKDLDSMIKICIYKTINGEKQHISFDYYEYINFCSLSEFVHLVVTYNRANQNAVKSFYYSYIQKCVELNTTQLDNLNHITIPGHYNYLSHSVNYSRLFYEMKFLCGNRIIDAVEDNKKNCI